MRPRKQGRSGGRTHSESTQVEVQIDDPSWRQLGPQLANHVKRAAHLTLAHAGAGNRERNGVTVLLTGNERVQAFNRQYRGKDKPTNVLSFLSQSAGYLGDIAIAHGVTSREADSAGLPLLDHVRHLVVHGALHLLGYDHEAPKDAELMEALEAEILAEMDIPNPYARRRPA